MTLGVIKKKTLALIEELNPESVYMTDDPDIGAKFNFVANQVMHELCRLKKLPRFVSLPVKEGDVIRFADIEKECGSEVYQISLITGVRYESRAGGTVLKMLESGTAEMDVFVYPEGITDKTRDSFEIELGSDILEIMPYGIAADLLKSDVSADYGSVYADRYRELKQLLDPRNQLLSVTVDGGVYL